ncbi:hypothetical protein AB6A40_001723 [Gnathostoma spinigerum]|uniref:Elongation factor EFG domain-containing protein n=1 Tax=Gnathostoma spinigerum TaxID=75299 RepID=A0ABD6E4U0_9BILA
MLLEPIMKVEVTIPSAFQGNIVAFLTQRNALIISTDVVDGFTTIFCEAPLGDMFGYTSELRSLTEGARRIHYGIFEVCSDQSNNPKQSHRGMKNFTWFS